MTSESRPASGASCAPTGEFVTQPKPPRWARRLLARKTKQQLAEVLSPHYPDKWEQR